MSVVGNLIYTLPQALHPPQLYNFVAQLVSAPHLGLLWWFSLSLLKDDFRLNTTAWLGMCVSTGLPTYSFLVDLGLVPQYHLVIHIEYDIAPLAVILHVIWVSLSGLKNDLINRRRVLRLVIIFLPLSALLLGEVAWLLFDNIDDVLLIRIVYILPVCVLLHFWLTGLKALDLDFISVSNVGSESPKAVSQNHTHYTRLIHIMEQEKAYLSAELTIGQLAERVGIPEHQLRTLINREMGFKNFAQFLARYRIKAIKVELSDPEQARSPILTLALNGGFSSLATFNRTFRAETGQSAGEFRKEVLSKHNQY